MYAAHMAISAAAYLKVGLGCIPDDTKNEMMEKREDTTSSWRLPPRGERGTDALSEGQRSAIGLAPHLLTAASVEPRRGLEEWDWQPDPSSLARNQVFIRFGQVMEEMEQFLALEKDIEHLVDELGDLEDYCGDEDIEFQSVQERRFIRQKIGGAKATAARLGLKQRRADPSGTRKKNRLSMMWHKRHKSRDKRMAKSARVGYRRSDVDAPEANLSEIHTGRMQQVDDTTYNRDHLRKLAGITESKSAAFSTTGIMEARRPTADSIVDRQEHIMLESFRQLMGWMK